MSSQSSSALSTSIPGRIISSSIGKKVLMAVTGFIAFGYVVGHMAGNLQIFIGQDQINAYAKMLHDMGGLLWLVRIVLLISFIAHIWLGVQLKAENWSSRPVGYQSNHTIQATLASKTMIWTGITIFSFFVYHVLHFTAHATNPEYAQLIDSQGRFDAYTMIVTGFQNPLISIVYLISMILVTFHISHGFSSMFQSMGWNHPKYQKKLKTIGNLIAVLIFIGFSSVPVAVLTGYLTISGGQ